MYKSKRPFNRAQLVFIVEAAMVAAFDMIESHLPCDVPGNLANHNREVARWNANQDEWLATIHGCKSVVAIQLPILWAQIEGTRINEGMGTGDFEGWEEFNTAVDAYVKDKTTYDVLPTMKEPNFKAIAEKFVDKYFKDYFWYRPLRQVP